MQLSSHLLRGEAPKGRLYALLHTGWPAPQGAGHPLIVSGKAWGGLAGQGGTADERSNVTWLRSWA